MSAEYEITPEPEAPRCPLHEVAMKLIYSGLPRRREDIVTTAQEPVHHWHCERCSVEVTRLVKGEEG